MSELFPHERPISARKTVFRITDIEYSNSQVDEKIVGIFRFEPSAGSTIRNTILVLAEIDGVGYVYDQLIDVVNNEAEHARTLLSHLEQEPVSRFEKVIQSINRGIGEFVKGEPSPINWSRVNMYVLELSDGHMCLAGIGRLMNMFLQAQGDGTYKTFDLFGSLDQKIDTDPEKVFSNIICGDFKAGDILFAGSKNFERLRNELRMKERLTTLPPVTAALEIRQDLENRGSPDDFVATLIACKEADQPKVMEEAPVSTNQSTESIHKLRQTEAETLRHLAPSILRKEGKTDAKEPAAPRIGAVHILKRVIGFVRNKFRREKIRDVASMASLRGMHAGFGSFLSRKKKAIIVYGITAIVLILVGTLVINHQRNAAAERAAWNASYDKIKADLDQAEGEAVYSEDVARRSLQSTVDRLASLDASRADRKQAVQKLQEQMDGLRTKLRHAVSVDYPTQIFAAASGLADGALVSPILFNGKLVVGNNAGNSVLVSDTKANSTPKEISIKTNGKKIISLAPGKTSVIAMLDDGSAIGIDVDKGDSSPLTLGASDMKAPSDATGYNGKLYVLDAANQQIWKFLPGGGGFGSPSKYLQAGSTSIANAVSLAIDSNIYVLTGSGSVVRYFNGGQDGFTLTPADPSLSNGGQIWTDPDTQGIAIADATNKRVLLYTKDGHLVAQYVSPVFKGPTDLVGDSKSKNLYVVDGNAVYQLMLP
jgi:hypothetical protein